MKNKVLLLIIILSYVVYPSFAAFPVKRAEVTKTITTGNIDVNSTLIHDHTSGKASWFSRNITHVVQPVTNLLNPERRRNNTVGLLSMIFGILGLIPGYGVLFSLTAIILGSIGTKRDEDFSTAGLILGIIGLVLDIIYLILAVLLITALFAVF